MDLALAKPFAGTVSKIRLVMLKRRHPGEILLLTSKIVNFYGNLEYKILFFLIFCLWSGGCNTSCLNLLCCIWGKIRLSFT